MLYGTLESLVELKVLLKRDEPDFQGDWKEATMNKLTIPEFALVVLVGTHGSGKSNAEDYI